MKEMGDIMKAMQSALELQKKAQQELSAKQVEGQAGGGMVRVTMNGDLEAKKTGCRT